MNSWVWASTPGVTRTSDVVWWFRQRVNDLGLTSWFHPSVTVQRRGATAQQLGEDPISRVVTERIVDHLEVVKVEHHEHHRRALSFLSLDRLRSAMNQIAFAAASGAPGRADPAGRARGRCA